MTIPTIPIAYVVVSTRDFSGAAIRSIHATPEAAHAARNVYTARSPELACPLYCRSNRRPIVGDFCNLVLALGAGWEACLPP